jgi:hypothetical protein
MISNMKGVKDIIDLFENVFLEKCTKNPTFHNKLLLLFLLGVVYRVHNGVLG